MSVIGYYYLHENGDLIFKRTWAEVESGGFVKKIWPVDPKNRELAYEILIEAELLGARKDRVMELREKWGITDDDCITFAGLHSIILIRESHGWRARYAAKDNVVGTGPTAFDAIVDLRRHKNTWESIWVGR